MIDSVVIKRGFTICVCVHRADFSGFGFGFGFGLFANGRQFGKKEFNIQKLDLTLIEMNM